MNCFDEIELVINYIENTISIDNGDINTKNRDTVNNTYVPNNIANNIDRLSTYQLPNINKGSKCNELQSREERSI